MYSIINQELKKILIWLDHPLEKKNFDIDGVFSYVTKEYEVSMSYGFLHPIFALVDVLCDSVLHSRIELKTNYSVEEAIQDLKYIIKMVDEGKINELENNYLLFKKLNGLYK